MKMLVPPAVVFAVLGVALNAGACLAKETKTSFKFAFAPETDAPGYTRILPATAYSKTLGYGFEPGRSQGIARRRLHLRQAILLLGRPAGRQLQHHGDAGGSHGGIDHHRQGRAAPADAGERQDGVGQGSRSGRSPSTSATTKIAGGGEVRLKAREKTWKPGRGTTSSPWSSTGPALSLFARNHQGGQPPYRVPDGRLHRLRSAS